MKSILAKRLSRSIGIDLDKTSALVDAGLHTPDLIMNATDEQLLSLKGIGKATTEKLRKKYKKSGKKEK